MAKPSRRQVLSALSAAGGALLAGCTADPDEPNTKSNTPVTTVGGGTSPTESTQSVPESTESTQSVPEFPGDTASDACPPFDDAAQVVCYDAVDPQAMPVVLVPETQTVQLDQPTDFTLRNQSEQWFETNSHGWELYKRVDGDWYYIMPRATPLPAYRLVAGEAHTWTLTVTTGSVSDGAAIDLVQGTESLSADGLGGGHYAFATDGEFEGVSYKEPTVLATSFELQASPLELTPRAAIAEVEWDGETLVARSTRGEAGDDDGRDAYILERIDDPEPDAEEVIVEQVVRDNQLRDAIALSLEYEATRVRLEEFDRDFPLLRVDRTYEFRGDHYRVRTQAGESS